MRTWKDLDSITGGLSNPSKMPGRAYGIPAAVCRVGGKLRDIKDSVCSRCYAYDRGRYAFDSVKAAQYRRLKAIGGVNGTPSNEWIRAMAESIKKSRTRYFRWHDSGDLQSLEHLSAIVRVAELTPRVKHWLPTRELGLIKAYSRNMLWPKNLTVRVSATRIDQPPPRLTFDWTRTIPTSTVHKNENPKGKECRAYSRGGQCGNCRACWDPNIQNVSYPLH